MKKVKITQIKSTICCKEPHKRTIKALGLGRINRSVEKELNPAIQGMVNSISYLLKVEDLD
ncbi:50S ribosomal protein L30 [soil metagenome]